MKSSTMTIRRSLTFTTLGRNCGMTKIGVSLQQVRGMEPLGKESVRMEHNQPAPKQLSILMMKQQNVLLV
uniref:Uncharacterized protein n=1 Tax=Brassica oleracea TaxID=3712 RepID=A0A3P6FEY5_BRAOL|nr:unnamed protein product [Brassica oleracea]